MQMFLNAKNAKSLTLKRNLLPLLIASLSLITANVHAQQSIEFDVPLLINKAVSGSISATITETTLAGEKNTTVTIPIGRLEKLISKFANDDQIETWLRDKVPSASTTGHSGGSVSVKVSFEKTKDKPKANATGKGSPSSTNRTTDKETISLKTLRQRGMRINFNPSLLEISSVIPRMGTQAISVQKQRSPSPEDKYGQAKFASGLNFNVRNTINHRATENSPSGLGDTSIDFSGFTSIGGFGGWSLFYEADYLEDDPQKFARRDVTLIHDSFKNGVRYSFGDVLPTVSNLQTSPNLLGVSIERNYRELNPFRTLNPTGQSSFTLDRAARVSFEVNGVIVDTRELEAGDYSVADFPLTIGANDVRVFVDDGSSRLEVANFSAFTDIQLLAPGLSNFGITAGVQRGNAVGRSRRYNDDPVALAFYERGINDNLTIGTNAEISEKNALLSSNVVFGSRVGIVELAAALSKRDGFEDGIRSTLRYNIERDIFSNARARFDLQLDYQSEDFGGFTVNGAVEERTAIAAALAFTRNGYSVSFNGNVNEIGDLQRQSFAARLSKSFRFFNLSLDYRYSKIDGLESTNNYGMSISSRFGETSIRGAYLSRDNEYKLGVSNSSNLGATGLSLDQLEFTHNDNIDAVELGADYVNPRFRFSVDHTEARSSDPQNNTRSSRSRLRAGTAIGFADGKFAFGRPFTDGFVIINPHKNLRGKKVSVRRNSVDGNVITTTKRLSTTLVPLNNSYQEQRLQFTVNDLPLGYDLGSSEIDLYPGFLAGYTFKLGSEAANTVIGKVLWPDQTAPSLIVGKMIPKNGAEELTVFTNKTGRFVAERASFGEYLLVFKDGKKVFSKKVIIEESDEPGLVQLGTITLERDK